MHAASVISLLALHQVCMGLLMYAMSRRMPRRGGLWTWAAALGLFGLALATRLIDQPPMAQAASLAADVAMVGGLLLLLRGMFQFLGQPPSRLTSVQIVIGYAGLHAALGYGAGVAAQMVGFNFSIGGLCLVFAIFVLRQRHELDGKDALRPPLVALAALLTTMGGLTLWRTALIVGPGTVEPDQGRFGQAYSGFAAVFAVLLGLILLWLVVARLHQQLVELSSRDALTRVLNGNGMEDVLARHFGARDAAPLTLLQIDVDHFKRINISHGHEAGDAMLRAVAAVLTEHVRGNDFVARIGGEEFMVGCVSTNPAAALALGERLRQSIGQLRVPWAGAIAPLRCTISVGVSGRFTDRAHWNHAARQADRALYAAKSMGRDRVVAIEGLEA